MAIAIVQVASGANAGGGATFTLDATSTHPLAATGAGNALILIASSDDPTKTVTSIVAGSDSATPITNGRAIVSAGTRMLDASVILSGVGGVASIVLTLSASGGFTKNLTLIEVSGLIAPVASATKLDTQTTVGTLGTGPSITQLATSAILIGGFAGSSVASNPRSGSPYTGQPNAAVGSGIQFCTLISATPATRTPEWSIDGSNQPFCALSIMLAEPAAATGPTGAGMTFIRNGSALRSTKAGRQASGFHMSADERAYRRDEAAKLAELVRRVRAA